MYRATLALLLAMAAPAQTRPPGATPTGTISGLVTHAGTETPIADATVSANRGPRGPQTTTDAQGRFTLRGLEAVQHRITARAPSGNGAGFPASAAKLVRLAPGQEIASIDFPLLSPGEISGRVIDQNKEPVPNIQIYLVAREYSLGALRYVFAGAAATDDQGEYIVKRVEPGRAFLLMAIKRVLKLDAISESPADPKLRKPAVVPTYYPGTPSLEGAQPLVLRAGERREGVDFRLLRSPARCIEGVLQGPNGPEALSFQIANRRPTSGASGDGAMFTVSPHGVTGVDGKIRLCDLYPGEYQLTVSSKPGSEGPAFYASTEIAVTDSDVRNVSLAGRPRVPVPGEVVWEGSPPDPPVSAIVNVGLSPMTRAPFRSEVSAAKSSIPGQFSFEGVLVDEYSIRISGIPSDAYIKDVTYAGRSVLYEPVRVGTAIGDASLRIVLARDGGTIAAKVADKDGNPVPDSRVLVMPVVVQSEAALAATMVTGQTDQNGSWTSARLAPGKYHVLALPSPPDKSPESIGKLWRTRHQSKEVEIGPNANLQFAILPSAIE